MQRLGVVTIPKWGGVDNLMTMGSEDPGDLKNFVLAAQRNGTFQGSHCLLFWERVGGLGSESICHQLLVSRHGKLLRSSLIFSGLACK